MIMYNLFLYLALLAPQVTPTIRVDFTKALHPVSPLTFGMDVSGYGGDFALPRDPVAQRRIKALNLGVMRTGLRYEVPGDPGSPLHCSGRGCTMAIPADKFVETIKAVGGEPAVMTVAYPGSEEHSVTDAVNILKHFIETKNPVKRWIISNEPDSGRGKMTPEEYVHQFNQVYDAMKAIDPTIKIGGPATASFNQRFIQTFLEGSGSRVDFVDFHGYGEGAQRDLPEAELLAQTSKYEDFTARLRQMIRQTVPQRAASIDIEIGEWNMNWNGRGAVKGMFTQFNTVWGACVIGRIMTAGGISRQYADKGGALGALFSQDMPEYGAKSDDTMPIYHAHGMFTGESLFRHFGSIQVSATAALPLVDVWASDKEKNIVVVNKDPAKSQETVFALTGVISGTAEVWTKDPSVPSFRPPVQKTSRPIVNGSFSYTLPPYSVTTFVLKP